MPLPTSVVTFLFTDIEGSTRLWEAHPEAMRVALQQHDVLLRQAIEGNGGTVFKTIGDAFCAAFPTADAGLNAARGAQAALEAEEWPEPISVLKVRMALHSGIAEHRDGDYFGPPLNRVARLLAAGHGGQTLLSQATLELLGESPDFIELGLHRLKDLPEPENIWQLSGEFPPLRSLPLYPHNLPPERTTFIGREQEKATLLGLLEQTRLLTLTGSGGCGKTRLAQQVAIGALERFPDGVWQIELAALTDSERLPRAIAKILEVKEDPECSPIKSLITSLKLRRLLLLLDNCEHLVESVAVLADELLSGCPQLTILATSREGLGVQGERNYRVPPLSLPRPPFEATRIDEFAASESVRLLLDRIGAHRPGLTLSPANVPAVAQLCSRLDGIPLAIELAAARTRSLAVEEINARLDDRFRLLTGGSRTALPRQQTLRALIDWSYDLLTEAEKDLLCRLSVFSGGWTLEAAESVCQSELNEDWEILDHLTSLTDKSLVVVELGEGPTRYRLLETVRQYALDRLLELGEGEVVRERHRSYYLAFIDALNKEKPKSIPEGMPSKWQQITTEYDNIWSALEWKRDQEALNLAIHLRSYWVLRGYLREGQAQLESLLKAGAETFSTRSRASGLQMLGTLQRFQGNYPAAHASLTEALVLLEGQDEPELTTSVLSQLGIVLQYQGNFPLAKEFYERAIALGEKAEVPVDIATPYNSLGLLHTERGELAEAQTCLEQALELFRKMSNGERFVALVLGNLGMVYARKGELDKARAIFEESLEVHRGIGDRVRICLMLDNLTGLALLQEDLLAAQVYAEESLTLCREIGDRSGVCISLRSLGDVARRRSELEQAKNYYRESLDVWRGSESLPVLTDWLESMAALCMTQNDALGMATLQAAADALGERIGQSQSPDSVEARAKYLAQAQAALAPEAFEAAYESGKALSQNDAIALALENL
ncbi:MAG: tetratricopeptide repeat protein [Armatimonas sp.]